MAPDAESVYPGQMLWALLRALSDDDLGLPARAEVAGSRFVRAGFGEPMLGLIDAVALGRRGRGDEAAAAVEAAFSAVGGREWSWYAMRLTAEAAVRDGWGEPAGWLREAEAFFAELGYGRVARKRRASRPGRCCAATCSPGSGTTPRWCTTRTWSARRSRPRTCSTTVNAARAVEEIPFLDHDEAMALAEAE